MIDSTRLKDLLSNQGYSRLEKSLICIATDNCKPKKIKEVRDLAISSGLRVAQKWNFSQIFGTAPELVVNTDSGWELTSSGQKTVADLAGPYATAPATIIASSLRQYLPKIFDHDTKTFLEEAIECFEQHHYRAAVVLTWVGAVSLMHHYVHKNELSSFNAEASRRDAKWKPAKSVDDLGKVKEHDFLQILESISLIGKNVKQELEACLKLRNGCGHPNSLKIGEARVAAHVEILILNVFSKF